MSIRKMSIEELELMSYTDIAFELISEDKKQYNTPQLFKEVCNLLGLSDEEFASKIADFFTALTTDGRFIFIDSSYWDLKENHVVKVVIDNGDEDDISEEDEDEMNEDSEDIEDDYSDESVDDSKDDEEDMKDLTIVDEEDIEE
ncbi:MAG: DNA-directed RNA polymerase subunit delta [Bacilli bacterium]|nr:DNA-directed RNA polymerase subunit delta [Bacilli bacterium]